MNILILNWRDTKHSWAGGSEIYIHELAKRWVKNGNSVVLFCGQDIIKKLPEKDKLDGVTIVRRGGKFSVYIWAFIYYLKELRKNTDVVIDVENGVSFLTPFYSRKKKICLVYHVHGQQFFYEMPFPINHIGYLIEKYMFPLVYRNTRIISISKSTKQELVKLGFNSKKISVIEPGVTKNKSLNNFNKFKKPTIIYLGRIKKYKRINILIEIFPKVLEKIPNARLIIAGWGSEAPLITDIVMKNKVKRKIELIGPVSESEKKTLLAKSWIFVNPSLHEGWGISVIEANLLRTPAIAFNVPGLTDSIRNKYSGFLCKDQNEMLEKLNEVLLDNKLRKKMEENAYSWASKFNWDKSAKESLKILKK